MPRTNSVDEILDRIRQNGDCRVWTGAPMKDGYARVWWAGKQIRVHTLVFAWHYGYVPPVVRHACDTPLCIEISHLLPGTHQDNMTDRQSRDRQTRGTRVHTAKLTEAQVREIRASREDVYVLAGRYGVHKNSIYFIRNRSTWKHVV